MNTIAQAISDLITFLTPFDYDTFREEQWDETTW